MDVEVVAGLDGEVVSYGFSIVPEDPSPDEVDKVEDDPLTAQIDRSAGEITAPMRVDLELGYPDRARLAGVVATADDYAEREFVPGESEGDYQPMSHGLCPGGEGLKQNYGGRWVRVGSVHTVSPGGGRHMRFTYTGSASSTLGYGVSTSGAYGTYSVGGTVTRSRSQSTTYPWYTSSTNVHLETQFSYGRYCVNQNTGGPPGAYHHRYVVRAIAHLGGTNSTSATAGFSTLCISYNVPGSGGEKTSTAATTWSVGAKTGGIIGIDLSTRTGFTTTAKIEYVFHDPGRLCGENDIPSGTPRRLRMMGPW